jgi:hypothetical protein
VNVVEQFFKKHKEMITGNISAFDRMILKGYLPVSFPEAAENFFSKNKMLLKEFKGFTTTQTEHLKAHAMQMALREGRPYEYLREHVRKDDYVREIAHRDNITEGLISVLAINEENHSFGLRYGKERPHLQRCSPRCLTLYFYYFDRHFGFMHIRLCTWMPFTIQVYINEHDWLARQMSTKGIAYRQVENAFVEIADTAKVQKIADRFQKLPWESILHAFARRVNPLLKTILSGMEYYWVIDQAEYATDIVFKDHFRLDELFKKFNTHAAVCFQAEDIMRFMGRKLHGKFNSTIVTDIKYRPEVTRVKHVVRGNWIKMYNKHGIVLRVETVINRPQEFRTFCFGRGKKAGSYKPLGKRITNMARYAGLCLRSNRAYIDALTPVDDPTDVYRELERICEPVMKAHERIRPLNPLREKDRVLFEAVIRGEHHIHGFKSNEIGNLLGITYAPDRAERRRQCAKVNRKLKLLRGHGLITRHGRSRRYRITEKGARHMNASIALHDEHLPLLLKAAA